MHKEIKRAPFFYRLTLMTIISIMLQILPNFSYAGEFECPLHEDFECPPYIDDVQRLTTDQPNWTATQRESRHRLFYEILSFSDGGSTMGMSKKTKAGELVTVYDMASYSDHNIYFSCNYHGTEVIMLKSIAKCYLECLQISVPNPDGLKDESFTCFR